MKPEYVDAAKTMKDENVCNSKNNARTLDKSRLKEMEDYTFKYKANLTPKHLVKGKCSVNNAFRAS